MKGEDCPWAALCEVGKKPCFKGVNKCCGECDEKDTCERTCGVLKKIATCPIAQLIVADRRQRA